MRKSVMENQAVVMQVMMVVEDNKCSERQKIAPDENSCRLPPL